MKYLNDEYVEYIKQNTVILFIINVEYDAPSDECCLNYYNCFGVVINLIIYLKNTN